MSILLFDHRSGSLAICTNPHIFPAAMSINRTQFNQTITYRAEERGVRSSWRCSCSTIVYFLDALSTVSQGVDPGEFRSRLSRSGYNPVSWQLRLSGSLEKLRMYLGGLHCILVKN